MIEKWVATGLVASVLAAGAIATKIGIDYLYRPTSVYAGDVNGDGKTDLVVKSIAKTYVTLSKKEAENGPFEMIAHNDSWFNLTEEKMVGIRARAKRYSDKK